jgi:diguanylate cyclase (GGDEF)-like protein/PAS domain S-box-containing protein
VGLAFYAAAALSLALSRGLDAIAAIWPCNGVLLAALLLAPRPAAWRYLLAAGVASMAVNLQVGNSAGLSATFTAANLGEAVLATWLLQRWGVGVPSFVDPGQVGRFCRAAGMASAAGALLATTLSGSLSPGLVGAWIMTDLLGLLTVTPIILVLADLYRRRDEERSARSGLPAAPLAVGLLALVATVTALTFAQSTFPMLFLPLAALIVATYQLGPLGATASVLLVALIGSALTGLGLGPVTLVRSDGDAAALFFQFYLLVLLASALPLAALLAGRDRLHRALAESNRMLGLAERAAAVGHWRLDVRRREVFWSPEVFRIHGLAGDEAPPLSTAIDAYHPDDQEAVTAAVKRTVDTAAPFELEARILRPDGSLRHVAVKGWAEQGHLGYVQAVFGVFQDVTHHVQAREAAERQAAAAAALADTDGLTGLPNRRKVLERLDEDIEAARRSGHPLSLAMLDVDRFKSINDRFGHAAGDQVLQRVASAIQGALRSGDVVGRLGGEEFLLLLPGAGAEDAVAVAERVRAAVEAGGAPGGLGSPAGSSVTVSLGVATFAGEAAGDLLGRADRALYEAKHSGRNALRVAA